MKIGLIISINSDATTNIICKWLLAQNSNFVRINEDTPVILHFIDVDSSYLELSIDNKTIHSNDIEFIIYRRGNINLGLENKGTGMKKSIIDYLNYESFQIEKFIFTLNKDIIFGDPIEEANSNKLEDYFLAKSVGLNTPKTYVMTNNQKKNVKLITKSIGPNFYADTKNKIKFSGGSILFSKDNQMPTFFGPSLVQEYVEKQIEIRVFLMNKEFYSMAIFSQSNSKTRIDYRNYDTSLPNRMVPIDIPKKLKDKILKFTKIKKISSASFDFIYDLNNNYIFLDCNVLGQFGWLSKNCNYYVEKQIAKIFNNEI